MEVHRHRVLHTVREYVTHWTVAGVLLAATGAAPEHWVAEVLGGIHVPRGVAPEWLTSVDYRLLAVIIGATIIVCDTIWRNHWRRAPVAAATVPAAATSPPGPVPAPPPRALRASHAGQKVGFCEGHDGARLAYATVGHGPPLVKAGGFLTHVEEDWAAFGHIWDEFAKDHTLLRYDPRGTGLSDWNVGELSFDCWLADLEAVVDHVGFTRFPLLALSQGCATAVAYAVRHPERVSHLILYGGFAKGPMRRAADDRERERAKAVCEMARTGWDEPSSAFRQIFATRFMPDATREQAEAFNALMLKVASPDRAAEYQEIVGEIDVSDMLAKVRTPTIVLHLRDEAWASAELGRQLAAGIPNARFVLLPGRNHVFMETEPAYEMFFREVRAFLKS